MMKNNEKIIVIMPAYNAASTLERTYKDIPVDYVDEIILGDDCSSDNTLEIAKRLGLGILQHGKNTGYGANQKTCYKEALKRGADVVVMIHPDYQYDATKVPQLIEPIINGKADVVFGSRILGGGALTPYSHRNDSIPTVNDDSVFDSSSDIYEAGEISGLTGGMPVYKYIANKFLTFCENVVLSYGLSEYHTGLRAYSRKVLETVPWQNLSNGFLFDTEIIIQLKVYGFKIKEIPIETRYFKEASEVGFFTGCGYGIGTLFALAKYLWAKILK